MTALVKIIKLSDFCSMSPADQDACLTDLVRSAIDINEDEKKEQMSELFAEIQDFESKYKISSDELMNKVHSREINVTSEICSWMILLEIKKNSESGQV